MSSLRLKNTYTKSLETFEPLDPARKRVTMYTCGPTVYSNQHIGNFRSFLLADVLRRTLELKGFAVRQVMNITDVGHMTEDHVADASGEDKLSKAARELGSDPYTVANHFERAFAEDAKRLRLSNYRDREAEDPSLHPRATRHVPEMLAMIQTLIERGYAYVDSAGQVYYEIARFGEYGHLSGKVVDELEAGARVSVRSEKRDPRDFALWKVDPKHLMQWDPHGAAGFTPEDVERLHSLVPQGIDPGIRQGFPGWHIECSAMSRAHLGETIDIHTGGEDNVFPHHECEIAQSHGAFGASVPAPSDAPDAGSRRDTFARYWVHARHLLFDGKKMAKREGTVFTIGDLLGPKEGKRQDVLDRFHAVGLNEGFVSGAVLRYALLSNPASQPMNFTFDLLVQAQSSVDRLQTCFTRLREIACGGPSGGDATAPDPGVSALARAARTAFEESLDDNLNMPKALSAVFGLVTKLNQLTLTPQDAACALRCIDEFDRVLDVLDRRPLSGLISQDELAGTPPTAAEQVESDLDAAQIRTWLATRFAARKAKQFQRADFIRRELQARGIVLEDVPQGVRWKRSG